MNNFKPTQTMLNNYIQNKLNDNETEQLELWLVDHPEVMDDLEMGVMFKQGVKNKTEINKRKISFNIVDFFSSRKLVPMHLFSYGLVAFLLFNILNKSNNSIENSVATFIELEKQRGLDSSIIEVQTSKNKTLVLRLFPDSLNEKYTLSIQSKTSNQKIEFIDLQADAFGAITVTLNNSENLYGKWEVLLWDSTHKLEQKNIIKLNGLSN